MREAWVIFKESVAFVFKAVLDNVTGSVKDASRRMG